MNRSIRLRSAGFTLLEIMLVVMIIAILAGTAIHFMGSNIDVAKRVAINTDLNAMKSVLMTYETLGGSAPTTQQGLKALVTKPEGSPKPRNWQKIMDKVPLDPFGNEYQYVNPGVHNPSGYDLFSAGKDRLPGTPDDIGNWESQ